MKDSKPPRLLRGAEVDELRGTRKTKRHEDIKRELLVPPVVRSKRDSRYPEHEIAAIIAAEIAGASIPERQALVRRLIAARKQA